MNKNASSPLKIIQCGIDDVKALSDVAILSYKDFYLHLWHDKGDWYIDHSFSPSVFKREITDPNHAFFLLREGENSIGFMKLNIERPLNGHEQYNCIELERIYLIKSATGKGYGREAVEFCIDYAKKFKKEIIWLKSMDTSPAIGFYESLGFRRCGEFYLDFVQMKEEFRGMVIMMKNLNA